VSRNDIKRDLFDLIEKYYVLHMKKNFVPGEDFLPYSGSVFDSEELKNVVDVVLSGRFVHGRYTLMFEGKFAKYLGVRNAVFVNSGSSANLLAVASLRAQTTPPEYRVKPGDEVITPALTFPTTLNPVLFFGLKPVFLDVDIATLNIKPELLEKAVGERTRVIFIPHTLGNPNDMDVVLEVAQRHNLLVIEDSCDALGSRFGGRLVGSFGVFGTFSFYPAHQITTGEGGMLVTNIDALAFTARSLRDWGRACVMQSCNPLTCGDSECPKSFKFSGMYKYDLPEDYDKRYTYINVGFNLQATEFQAALGVKQIERVEEFCRRRRENFAILRKELEKFEEYFILPEWHKKSDPCWFAFPITIRDGAPFRRKHILRYLSEKKIDYRLVFAGDITEQPGYHGIEYRTVGGLEATKKAMRDTFFVGVYPGLGPEHMYYIADTIRRFVAETTGK